MQTEIPSFSDFEARTDRLAIKLGVTLDALPPVIGMSRDMLFGYRKGRYPITRRAAIKLATAEREAGIGLEIVRAENPRSLLDELRTAIEKAESAESLISDLKQTLEKLIKKL